MRENAQVCDRGKEEERKEGERWRCALDVKRREEGVRGGRITVVIGQKGEKWDESKE